MKGNRMSQHRLETGRKRWTARRVAVAIVSFVLAAILGVIAWAAYQGRANVSGGGTTAVIAGRWASAESASGVTTTPPIVTDSNRNLALPTASLVFFPGDAYTFTANIGTAGVGQRAAVAAVEMPGLPAGYTATITGGCGRVVSNYQDSSSTGAVTIRIATDDNVVGGDWTLNGAAVMLAPSTKTVGTTDTTITCAPFSGG